MKKEDLIALGLTEEQAAKIFEFNGKDIAAEQKKTEKAELDRDNYKGQLETAQTALKEFEGVDVKDLQGKITQLTTDLQSKETEYQSKLSDIDFNHAIEAAITGAGGKNAKAVKALLDIDLLKTSKDQTADIKTAIEACQKDNGYLFGADEPINSPVGPTSGAPTNQDIGALFHFTGVRPNPSEKKG